MTYSWWSSISLIKVSTASWPKESPPVLTRLYASSMNRTPPKARQTAVLTLGAVCPTNSATRSALETSLKVTPSSPPWPFSALRSIASGQAPFAPTGGSLMTPSSFRSSPTKRATTVLPVPGFPRNFIWKDWPIREVSGSISCLCQMSNSTMFFSWTMESFTSLRPMKSSLSRCMTLSARARRALADSSGRAGEMSFFPPFRGTIAALAPSSMDSSAPSSARCSPTSAKEALLAEAIRDLAVAHFCSWIFESPARVLSAEKAWMRANR
mmetsp:Transcript_28436/g.61811  ORF Transcript_28436/g.61811 Transcript_28436/m.61811 type:complete len:268 (-) Transcript_28436:314-1117(-)